MSLIYAVNIIDRGVQQDERVHLQVLADTNLINHAVFATDYNELGEVSSHVRHAFWFGEQRVKAGDQIALMTRAGPNQTVLVEGRTIHYLHWGLAQAAFADAKSCVVVVQFFQWQAAPVFQPAGSELHRRLRIG